MGATSSPGEADTLLGGTLDALHIGQLGADHEVRVWADPPDSAPGGWVYLGPLDVADATWELFWIGVAPARHGQGGGHGLLRFVEEHVRRAGGRALVIETSSLPQLARARKFYADRGYVLRDVTPSYYGNGDDKLTFVKLMASPPAGTR